MAGRAFQKLYLEHARKSSTSQSAVAVRDPPDWQHLSMLKPHDQIDSNKQKAAKTSRLHIRDLVPPGDATGGSAILRRDEPLEIPPPGFIVSSDESKLNNRD